MLVSPQNTITQPDEPASALELRLLKHVGPVMGGELLWRSLGYGSAYSFRRALRRGEVEIRTFRLPRRRGTYAFTADVVRWLERNSIADYVEVPNPCSA